jgi:allophanate hydrolase
VLKRCADDLWSIATSTPAEAQAIAAQLRAAGDWVNVVPGIDSVVVRFDAPHVDAIEARDEIASVLAAGISPFSPGDELVEIPVAYGGDYGPDLDAVCRAVGMSPAELIALHTGSEFMVDMIGFTPGFAFIGGLDERLRIPRRKEPRQHVPAGSVGIADSRTGLYAMASPGGWSVIGRTPAALFDPLATNPFALEAGMRIRFTAIDASEFDQ